MGWVNLELFIQSEASQKEENKYHILTHICGIYKDGTEEAVCKALMEMQTEKTDLSTQAWDWKERVKQMEKVMSKHVHYHK